MNLNVLIKNCIELNHNKLLNQSINGSGYQADRGWIAAERVSSPESVFRLSELHPATPLRFRRCFRGHRTGSSHTFDTFL